jgi:Reeler domain
VSFVKWTKKLDGMESLHILLHLALISSTFCSPNGAPATQAVCDSLTPGHGFESQKDPSPFSLIISSNSVKGGETIKIVIQSSESKTFRGFYVQARTTGQQYQFIGEFLEDESGENPFNFRSCGSGTNNAVTHANREDKTSISFHWKAPQNFVGEVNFQ